LCLDELIVVVANNSLFKHTHSNSPVPCVATCSAVAGCETNQIVRHTLQ
jgi:hypothetical protein